jgi:micrococcal nuclease
MKKYGLLFYLLFLSSAIISGLCFAREGLQVRWVSDGDTIILSDGRHVRYIGINAPEIDHENQKAEPFAYQAKRYNEQLVFSKTVRLEFDKEHHDQYGRLLAYVFLPDGTFVNKEMIAKGYAYFLSVEPNGKYDQIFLQSQHNAMAAKAGLWREIDRKEGSYLGSRRSKRFHTLACPFGQRIGRGNRVFFKSKWDAFWAGFAPCKNCLSGKIITKTQNNEGPE